MNRSISLSQDNSADRRTAIIELLRSGAASHLDCYKEDLSNCDLKGLNLERAKFLAVLLKHTDLSGANLINADLRGVDLSGANLTGADLTGANLCRSNLENANLTATKLDQTKLQVARYNRHTLWPETFSYKNSGAVGPNAQLNGAFLNTVNLRQADVQSANFLGAYLSGTDFTGANLESARFSGADLRKAFFTGAYLRKARLVNVDLSEADFRAADFTEAELENLQSIAGADFGAAILSDHQRSQLLSHPNAELDVWNTFTRRSTRDSLKRDC
jgi:uncharacterized protein YjbI with pentapeptide repeats